jgi:hypothetical protein
MGGRRRLRCANDREVFVEVLEEKASGRKESLNALLSLAIGLSSSVCTSRGVDFSTVRASSASPTHTKVFGGTNSATSALASTASAKFLEYDEAVTRKCEAW